MASVPRRIRQTFARTRRPTADPEPWNPGFDFRPPPCPPGMTTAPPDFVGIGAQRSGTSWWFALLSLNPEIFTAHGHKELHYLSRFGVREPTDPEVADYAGWFPRPPGAIAGEWTPYYMVHYWTGALLQRMAPDAKVLVILRDPVDRYCSGIARDAVRGEVRHTGASAQHFRGFYAQQLRRLAPYVADDRMLVLQYERCVLEPQVQLDRTFRFLGVEPIEIADFDLDVGRRVEPHQISDERRAWLVEEYRDDVAMLAARYPELDISLWKNFR